MTYFPTGTYAAIIIPWNVFRSTPIYWFGKPLNEMGVTLKVAARYQYDNRHSRIEYRSGEEFSFSLVQVTAQINSPTDQEMRKKFPKYHGGPNASNAWTVTLWNTGGYRQVYEKTFISEKPGEPFPEEVLDEMGQRMEAYIRGAVDCSDCGATTAVSGGRHYFAGTYCPGCWNGASGKYLGRGGWKEIEAKETYE